MKTVIKPRRNLEYRLKKRLTPLRKALVHYSHERRNRLKVPFRTRWKAWRLRIRTSSYLLYELERNDPENYLRDFTDIDYLLDYPEARCTDDKFQFAQCMQALGIATPPVIGLTRGGSMVWPEPAPGQTGSGLSKEVKRLLDQYGRLVFRPVVGGAGRGVLFLRHMAGSLTVNGVNASMTDFIRLLQGQQAYVITPFIEQTAYARTIYPDALNTLRVLTLWDSVKNQPVFVQAVHRFGSTHSYPMDHFHDGVDGICAPVDPELGVLGSAVTLERNGRLKHLDEHPETGGQISGVQLPFWDDVVAWVLKAAKYYAMAPYIGWDVAITDTGPCFIEANSPPGPSLMQVHAPLLENQRIRRCYQELGLV